MITLLARDPGRAGAGPRALPPPKPPNPLRPGNIEDCWVLV
jgi:hypothetical protein